jgi:hypothetical protein
LTNVLGKRRRLLDSDNSECTVNTKPHSFSTARIDSLRSVKQAEIDQIINDNFPTSEEVTYKFPLLPLEEKFRPSKLISRTADELNDNLFHIKTPELFKSYPVISQFRGDFFNHEMKANIHAIQNSPHLHKFMEGKDWYTLLARTRSYNGGRILFENMAELLKSGDFDLIGKLLRTYRKFLTGVSIDEDLTQLQSMDFLELAAGNGDISIRLVKMLEEMGLNAGNVKALDYASSFVANLRSAKRKVNASIGDLTLPPEKFFLQTSPHIPPNSIDVSTLILGLDRLQNVNAALTLVKLLSKLDGSSRLLIGVNLPFESSTDLQTKNEKVSEIVFWKKDEVNDLNMPDVRNRWMQDAQLQHADVFKDLQDEKEIAKASILFDLVLWLRKFGIETYSLGEQNYEVYSPHCIVETAKTIREKYGHIRFNDYGNHMLNDEIRRIFEDPASIPDNKIVGIPQQYRLILLGCKITEPIDGSNFKK